MKLFRDLAVQSVFTITTRFSHCSVKNITKRKAAQFAEMYMEKDLFCQLGLGAVVVYRTLLWLHYLAGV